LRRDRRINIRRGLFRLWIVFVSGVITVGIASSGDIREEFKRLQ